jgi:hypothetical protein
MTESFGASHETAPSSPEKCDEKVLLLLNGMAELVKNRKEFKFARPKEPSIENISSIWPKAKRQRERLERQNREDDRAMQEIQAVSDGRIINRTNVVASEEIPNKICEAYLDSRGKTLCPRGKMCPFAKRVKLGNLSVESQSFTERLKSSQPLNGPPNEIDYDAPDESVS